MRWKIWFHRARAGLWVIIGSLSFAFGWQNSVVLVWLASVYANVVSYLGASEAADDRVLAERLDRLETKLDALLEARRSGDA